VENRSGQIAWYINRPIRNVLDTSFVAIQGCLLILPKLLQSSGNSESVVSLSNRRGELL